jgi:hypothetical protein
MKSHKHSISDQNFLKGNSINTYSIYGIAICDIISGKTPFLHVNKLSLIHDIK